jgi:hypothetical protein
MTGEPSAFSEERAPRPESLEEIAEAIYGLILSTAVVAALSEDEEITAAELFAAVAVTALVFWLAHVYARWMASGLVNSRGLSLGEIRRAMRRQWPLVVGAFPALAALALGWVGLISLDTAVGLAIGAGVAALAGCGVVIARRRRLSPLATLAITAFSGALGLVMVALKIAIH